VSANPPVGAKPRDRNLAGAIRDYEARAGRYWPLEVHEVREEPARSGSADLVRKREGERLSAAMPHNAQLIRCEQSGRTLTSEQFASWLQELRERARDVAIVIGGAFGLDPSVTSDGVRGLALAPWTLPHELARLVLAEQLYRAGTLLRGEPYHK
jgi:23S rRNA (pseudouridine1915-N3)-methyltransferase